jgi:hypothetical protein
MQTTPRSIWGQSTNFDFPILFFVWGALHPIDNLSFEKFPERKNHNGNFLVRTP